MDVENFADVQTEFVARIQRAIYCNMATVDRRDRPRSRMMHPIWEFSDEGPISWVISWPQTLKSKHLARNSYVSLAYIADKSQPVYVDCRAEWIDEPVEQWRVWELHKTTPPPVGFDPEPHYGDIDHPQFGILKFTPWRVELANLYGEPMIWRAAD